MISILSCLVILAACAPGMVPPTGSGSGSAGSGATGSGSGSDQPSAAPSPSQTPASGEVSSVPEVSTTIPGSGTGVTVEVGTSEPGTAVPLPVQGGGIGPGAFITPGPDGNLSVTLEDQGKTVRLKVGERFLLNLGEGYDWQPEVADPSVISRVPNITVIRGAQGIYEAHKAGTTTLTVTGDPACRQVKPPCAMPSRMFTITIEVQ